ncbi:17557_t:CDS:2, partial [Gigaspora margarita]
VTLNTPLNVQKGSTITISWTLSGIQTTHVALGICNELTNVCTVIDADLNLSLGKESWMVTVDAGNYRLYIVDQTTLSYVYSNTFAIQSQSTNPGSSNNSGSSNGSNNSGSSNNSNNSGSSDDTKTKILIAVIPGVLSIVAAILGYYFKKKLNKKKENNSETP